MRHLESQEQIKAMDWLRQNHPEIAEHTMHIGNERKSSFYLGCLMKKMGVLRGASDLFMAWPKNSYHGLFIEIKTKKGKPTPHQLAFIERMNKAGYLALICHGSEEVIQAMKNYIHQGQSSSASCVCS